MAYGEIARLNAAAAGDDFFAPAITPDHDVGGALQTISAARDLLEGVGRELSGDDVPLS